jgi:hypothetical protein
MTRGNQERGKPNPAHQNPETSESLCAPTPEKELAEVCASFADVCQYFSQKNIDLPPQIVEEVRLVSKLAVGERIARIKHLNQELMRYLNDAGPNPRSRQ